MAYGSLTSATAFITLKAVDQTAAGIATATGRIKAFAAKLDAMGNAMIFKGMATLAPAMAGLVLPSRAINQWAEFERYMLGVQVRAKGTKTEYENLMNTVRKYARESQKTPAEVAQAAEEIAAGSDFTMEQIGKAFPNVLDYAIAVRQDSPAEAAKNVIGQMNAFGMTSADQMKEVVDKMAMAVNSSAMHDPDLSYSMQQLAAEVAQAGGTLDDALAMTMVTAKTNIKGSKAGTALRQLLAQAGIKDRMLVNERTGEGITSFDVGTDGRKQFKSVQQRLVDLAALRAGMDDAEKAAFDAKIWGARASSGVKTLLNHLDELPAAYAALADSEGYAENARKHMESGLFGSIKKIQSAWQDLMLSVGQQFGKAMHNVEGFIVPILNRLSDWVAKHGAIVRLVTEILMVLLAIGAGLILGGLAIKLIGVSLAAICGLAVFLKSAIVMIGFVLYNVVCLAWVTILQLVLAVIAACMSFVGIISLLGIAIAGIFLYGVGQVSRLGEIFGATFSGVFALLTNGEFTKAWQLLCKGFELAWLQLCNSMKVMFWAVMDQAVQWVTWFVRKMNDISEWTGVGRWETLDDFDKGANAWSQSKIDKYTQKGADLIAEIDALKKEVADAKKPWSPEDVENKQVQFELPKAQLGEAIQKLSGRGVSGAGAALEAIRSNTLQGWKKFQENMGNTTQEGILDNTGRMAETLDEMNEKLDMIQAEAL